MKRTVTGIFLLACLFVVTHVAASLRFDRYDSEHGLSQESITFIFQDSFGFIWIGTEDGLNRFDGVNFKVFKHQSTEPNSLSHNYVTGIVEDGERNLWLTTYNGGLNRFDRNSQQFEHFKHHPEDPASVASNRILSLTMINNELWLGMMGKITVFDLKTQSTRHLDLPAEHNKNLGKRRVTDMLADIDSGIWIGTEGGGLYRYNNTAGSFMHYLHDSQDSKSIGANNIRRIYLDSNHDLWFATAGGLSRYHRKSQTFSTFKHQQANPNSLSDNMVKALVEDHKNRLWVGTSNGLNRLDAKRGKFTRYLPDISNRQALTNGFIESLSISKDNVLWVGLSAHGLNKSNLDAEQFNLTKRNIHDEKSISGNIIWAIAQSHDGNLWIGTEDGGLNNYNRQTREALHYRHDPGNDNSLSSDKIYSVLEVAPGEVWVGTVDKGLNFLDLNNNKVTRYRFDLNDPESLSSDTVLALHQDQHQRLWIGTRNGFNRFDSKTQKFKRYLHDENDPTSIGDNLVGDIYQTGTNTLWLATAGSGLNRMNMASGEFIRYIHDPNDDSSIASNTVMAITPSLDGGLWLSSMAGIIKFDIQNNRFTHTLNTKQVIYAALQTAPDQLWFDSNQGLKRMNLTTGKIDDFDVKDGLQSNEFNFGAHAKISDGELVFAGNEGFNHFNPNHINTNQQPLKVTLTGLNLFNKAVSVSPNPQQDFTIEKPMYLLEQLTLSHRETLIGLAFSSLDYINPQSIRYQYRLEGIDDRWIDADPKMPMATYTNLTSGRHTFMVRAKRKNGDWGEVTTLAVEVFPPPWRSWWAYTLYFLIVASVIADFFYQRHLKFKAMSDSRKQLAAINENLDELVKQRTAELSETLEQLKNTQDQLIESEKMSSLIGVVVGVAHEMNTPLGIMTTASSQLRLDVEKLTEKVNDKQLSRKDLEYFTQLSGQALDLLDSNIYKATILVTKFKTLSEQSHEEKLEHVSMNKLLEQIAIANQGKLSSKQVKLRVETPKDLYLHTYPKVLKAIIDQLIENTLVHGCSMPEHDRITIEVFKLNETISLIYADNGTGLDPLSKDDLFEPFYTTKRGSDCTGLGMSIVYNQVTHILGGTISYDSDPGQGLTLRITFPIGQQQEMMRKAS